MVKWKSVLSWLALCGAFCTPAASRDFHVSTKGNDSWNGTLRRPFRTLERARDAARTTKSEGATIFIGVTDEGALPGLDKADVARINQLISNAASQNVRSPLTVQSSNVAVSKGRVVIVLAVPKGLDKPYFDRNGVIWLKNGADKRRVNSKEELRRLFQFSDQFHADQLPTKAGIDRLDKLRFRDFLRSAYNQDYPDFPEEQIRLLQNMGLATEEGLLNLAGVLLFAERPEWIKPLFIVKAIRYPGNSIHSTEYLDAEDFSGPLPRIFEGSLAFIMRNLRKVQSGQGVNAPGLPEIPPSVFEELLVNALVHRDYLVNAAIRLFIFDDRIEIISPGHLPNNLTVEKIRSGISNIRNPILVSYAAKGCCLTEDWAQGSSALWRNGRISVLPMTETGPCSSPPSIAIRLMMLDQWKRVPRKLPRK